MIAIRSAITEEAMDWRDRVYATGGTSSGVAMSAVNSFCRRIEGSGLRSLFFRLSLVCGDDLLASIVPLYRGPNRTGTQLGNAIDENNGPLVGGDYSLASGIQFNGVNKYLELATNPVSNIFPDGHTRNTGHISAAFAGASTAAQRVIGGGDTNGFYWLDSRTTATRPQLWGSRSIARQAVSTLEHWILKRDAGGNHSLYVDGITVMTSSGASTTNDTDAKICLGASGDHGGGVSAYFSGRVAVYSFGETMNDAQAATFHSCVTAFFSAIGRS